MDVLAIYDMFDIWAKELSRRMKIDIHQAKDVCQTVFLELYEMNGRNDLKVADPLNFIKGYLMRRAIDSIRRHNARKRRESSYMKDTYYNDPMLKKAIDAADQSHLLDTLLWLSEVYQPLLRDFYTLGLPRKDLAVKYNKTDNSIRCLLAKGRDKIKKHLALLRKELIYEERKPHD